MPGIVRKLLIFAAADAVILQPSPPRNHPPATQQAIRVDYKGNVGPLLKDRREEDTTPTSLEAHGIIGATTGPAPLAPRDTNRRQASSRSRLPSSSSR